MNEQRFIDASLAHIRQQGAPSIDLAVECGSTFCIYNGPKGTGCAFFPAIMKFDPEMEGEGADQYPKDHLHEWARDLDIVLVSNVQSAHDCNCRLTGEKFVDAFNDAMREACRDYNDEHEHNDLVADLVYREAA